MLISSLFVASVFCILCSSFEHKRTLWRRNLWKGIWSCQGAPILLWMTLCWLLQTLVYCAHHSSTSGLSGGWTLGKECGRAIHSWRTYPSLNESVLVALEFGILCLRMDGRMRDQKCPLEILFILFTYIEYVCIYIYILKNFHQVSYRFLNLMSSWGSC